MPRKILVTNALPYANGSLHIGHIIEAVQTDIWVRFQRMQGHDCIYVCAEDTHGTPVMIKAQSEGITPEELITRVAAEHRADYDGFLIGHDHFHSTHSPENKAITEDLYRKLKAATGEAPAWNFHKYLVDRQGNTVASYGSRTKPDDAALLAKIDELLAQPAPH